MFTYRIVEPGTADYRDWLTLRTDLYLESGLITPDQLSDEFLYLDDFDAHSIHLLALDSSGRPAGCCRMIEGDRSDLQVTRQFGVDVTTRSMEVSGTAVRPEWRGTFLTLGFYRALFHLATERGYDRAYLEVEEPFLASLEVLGLPIEVVSEPRWVYNAINVAVLVRPSEVVASLASADAARNGMTRFAEYFVAPFTWRLDDSDVLRTTPELATE